MSTLTLSLRQPRNAQSTPINLSSPATRQLDSSELLQGGRTIEIKHNGAVYRLYATRLGKLILTK
jgi:hemin uptake protein HemP